MSWEKAKIAYADNEDADKPVNPQSLRRAFFVCVQNLNVLYLHHSIDNSADDNLFVFA